MIRITIALLISCVLMSSCASMMVPGQLQQVTDLPKPKKPGTLIYRAVSIRPAPKNSLVISADKEEKVPVGEILRSSGLFSKVTPLQEIMGVVTLSGSDSFGYKEEVLKNEFPKDADYFLDLQYSEVPQKNALYMYWMILHMFSFGLIPITAKDPIVLKATLYDGRGKQLQVVSIYDEPTVWAWSPLVFVNGGHMLRHLKEVQLPSQQNALNNTLLDLRL